MGTIHHVALVVTSNDLDLLRKARRKAKELFDRDLVTKLRGDGFNGYNSFMVAPSGSKLGWEPQVKHANALDRMVQYLNTFRYKDRSMPINYVKVSFGELGLQASDSNGNELDSEGY